MEPVTIYGEKSCGTYGAFEIEIKVAASKPFNRRAAAVWDAAYDAAKLVKCAVMADVMAHDPDAQKHRAAEREQIVGLFPAGVFVEEIPNGYCSDWCCKHLPWFIITTEVGRFRIGWRKRVIHIEWTDTHGTATAEELFAAEDVTKGERYIHAWTVEKAREYIAAVIASTKGRPEV